jgi:hypothetical protein
VCGTSPIRKEKSQWQMREKVDSYSKALREFTQRNAFNYFTGVKRSSILSSLGVKDAASQCLLGRDYRSGACPVAPEDLSASGGWYWGGMLACSCLAMPGGPREGRH